jgi:hypothetical protein
MKLLDAVNLVMPKLGERPVTSLDAKHPTLAILLPIVEQTLKSFLIKGWWFNEYKYEAFPDTSGKIVLGTDALSFVPGQADTAVLRGQELFNPATLSYTFSGTVKGKITQKVKYDDLPESAAYYVLYAALSDAYATDLGASQELNIWSNMAASAWSDVLAEHLRQRKYSTRKTVAWRRMRNAMRS